VVASEICIIGLAKDRATMTVLVKANKQNKLINNKDQPSALTNASD
jgi:hypothetical protein